MNKNIIDKIDSLIKVKKIDEAQFELSKLGPEYFQSSEYLYLRSKIFYINKLYYLALDTLLIALEFGQNDKIYSLISKIYNILGNKELSKKVANVKSRSQIINYLKNELSGIYRKEKN